MNETKAVTRTLEDIQPLPNAEKVLGLVRLSRKLPADHPTWEPQSLDLRDWASQKGLQMVDVLCLIASLSPANSKRVEAHAAWHVKLPGAIEGAGVRWIVIPRFTPGFKYNINSAWCIAHNVGLIEAFPRIAGKHIRFPLPEAD